MDDSFILMFEFEISKLFYSKKMYGDESTTDDLTLVPSFLVWFRVEFLLQAFAWDLRGGGGSGCLTCNGPLGEDPVRE